MESRVRVVVIHNRPLVYEGVRAVLEASGEFTLLGSAREIGEAGELCAELEPDVLLVDLPRAPAEVDDVLSELSRSVSSVPVVVLSSHCSPHSLRRATSLAIRGFVCELAPPEELVLALRSVASGNYYFDSEAAERLVRMVSALPDEAITYRDEKYESLTAREREIFRMLAQGHSNKEIAFELGISRKTVETHHQRICRKLSVFEAVDIVRYAARLGIIDL
ncbi:MAG: LuxR C-terminal-related transcriptional regulator [Spirochaetaceae bacterium]